MDDELTYKVLAAIYWSLLSILTACAIITAVVAVARAHDNDPEVTAWMATLINRNTHISCCGQADAYTCSLSVEGPVTYCTITDDRHVMGRPNVPVGTKTMVPDRAL